MNIRQTAMLSVIAAAITVPGLSFANSVWHPASGEAGFTYHPDHLKNTKTRADVQAEVEAARKDGTLALMQRNVPVPAKAVGPGKTRRQVLDEVQNESPAARRARMELQTGG